MFPDDNKQETKIHVIAGKFPPSSPKTFQDNSDILFSGILAAGMATYLTDKALAGRLFRFWTHRGSSVTKSIFA